MTLALPAAAYAADVPPVSNTTDPSSVAQPPAEQSAPLKTPERGPDTSNTASKAPRFTLNRVQFDGVSAVSPTLLEPAWREFVGKPVSLSDLRAIARRAELLYGKAGYPFVAIVLTPQKVEDGIVHFTVVEGRISSLTVLSNDSVARRQVAAAFTGLIDRAPLSSAEVEGAYARAKKVPGLVIDGALRRGGSPGGMDLVVRARHQDWRVYANTNNLYPETVGPWGALIGIDHFGASPYGDQTSFQIYSSLNGGQQTVARLNHRRILNASGTEVSGLLLVANAKPGGVVAPLDLATNVVAVRLNVSQPLIQRLGFSLEGSLSFEANDQKTKVFTSVDLTNDRLRIVSLAFHGDGLAFGGTYDYGVEIRQGVAGLNSSRKGDLDLSRAGADPQATVGRLFLDGLSPSFRTVRVFAKIDGQLAGAPLAAPEQYAVGNLTVGRGFQPGASFGDSAVGGTAEIRFGPYAVRGFKVQPFAFYDAARLWNLTPGAHRDHTVSSAGAGMRIEAPGRMHLDLTYAAPQTSAQDLGDPTPHPRVLLSLTVGLDELFKGRHR
jgi:hemolysin activation/secretion protein